MNIQKEIMNFRLNKLQKEAKNNLQNQHEIETIIKKCKINTYIPTEEELEKISKYYNVTKEYILGIDTKTQKDIEYLTSTKYIYNDNLLSNEQISRITKQLREKIVADMKLKTKEINLNEYIKLTKNIDILEIILENEKIKNNLFDINSEDNNNIITLEKNYIENIDEKLFNALKLNYINLETQKKLLIFMGLTEININKTITYALSLLENQ